MKREIEIEYKYQVVGPMGDVFSKVKFSETKNNVDVYLDTKSGELFQKGIFLRIRDEKKLDFKFNMSNGRVGKYDHTHCDEYSFKLPFEEKNKRKFDEVCSILKLKNEMTSLKQFMYKNKLNVLVTVDKLRKTFEKDNFEITIDELKGVGTFIEIEKDIEVEDETPDEKNDVIKKLKTEIETFALSLSLNLKQIPIGYCEIVLRQQNFELYKKGQYVLPEDQN